MSNANELLRRALESWDNNEPNDFNDCMEEIRTFLAAEPEAEPVAWMREDGEIGNYNPSDYGYGTKVFPLYLHPPKPEPARKPMTDEEMEKQYEIDKEYFGESVMRAFYNGVRFAEKHHGIGGDDE